MMRCISKIFCAVLLVVILNVDIFEGSRISGSSYRSSSSGKSRTGGYSSSHTHGVSSGRVSKPNTHSSSHFLPISTGARNPSRTVTSRPKTYNWNTPRSVVTSRPSISNRNQRYNSTSGGYHSSNHHTSFGRHNTTQRYTASNFGKHNTTSRSFNTTGGRYYNTSGTHSGNSHSSHGRYNSSNVDLPYIPNIQIPKEFLPDKHHTPSRESGSFQRVHATKRPNTRTHNSTNLPHIPTFTTSNSSIERNYVTNDKFKRINVTKQQSSMINSSVGGTNLYAPSAPPLLELNQGKSSHVASAPPYSELTQGSNQPPGPGWNVKVTSGVPYPNRNLPPHVGPTIKRDQTPPLYTNYPNHPSNAPPPYVNYPTYTGYSPTHYPTHPNYPVQPPGAGYQPNYYPPPSNLPPPPPGFSPYGAPLYVKEKSGIRGSDVVAGLALWELTRNHHTNIHHHHYHNAPNYESTYVPSYHETMRERYTTRITPSVNNQQSSGAYNILEMTHYITPDQKGVISSSKGNMTCISIYNAKKISDWNKKLEADFHKSYPNSTFPLYQTGNTTKSENFTIIPGRIIHREPVSISCCGTNRGPIDLKLLTNGKHSNVNCVHHSGHIPIRKLNFVRVKEEILNTSNWFHIQLVDPNITTPTPLAPFPPNFPGLNNNINTTTPTPLAPFPPNFPGLNNNINTTTPTPLAPYPPNFPQINKSLNSSIPAIDFNQTFDALGINKTQVDLNQTYPSLASNITTIKTEDTTSNPSNLIIV